MKDFISAIKNINTDILIYRFSELSIEMFQKNQHLMSLKLPVMQFGGYREYNITLSAWDIPEIEYLSVKYSNDFRGTCKIEPAKLVNLYRGYENDHSVASKMSDADISGIFRCLVGMTAEQFQYQNMQWIFERFNRNYYILLAASHFEHRSAVDINAIVKNVFGYTADDYIAVLLIVFWLCSQHPDPLSAPEHLYYRKKDTVLTPHNLEQFIQYYSCSYDDLRKFPLGKQLLYSKPFIKTQRYGTYLSSNMFLIAMMIANGLYWVVRDFYRTQKSQLFVNTFGLLFEDYVKDLASKYCKLDEWETLPQAKKKGADFTFDFGKVKMLVEAKTALLQLDAKQQVPNIESIENYFKKTIGEAYDQLQSSYLELKNKLDAPVLKVILLYDEFSNTALVEQSMTDILEKDPLCFVMTIREFEMLLYLHHDDILRQDRVLDKILENNDIRMGRKSFGAVYSELSIFDNPHLKGEMDYFSKLMLHFRNNLV